MTRFPSAHGLLGHNRAHLRWFSEARAPYPQVVFENCSSGAMRADFAMLELFDFQSTSDQEDFRLYPAIAAGASLQMLPEQAGNWAYPQPSMSAEEIACTMVTGLSGRLYPSGFLHGMTPQQFKLVTDATDLFKRIRNDIAGSTPQWPLGYPQWYGDRFALALSAAGRTLLYVWHRGAADAVITLPPSLGAAASLRQTYPAHLAEWQIRPGSDGGTDLAPAQAGPSGPDVRDHPGATAVEPPRASRAPPGPDGGGDACAPGAPGQRLFSPQSNGSGLGTTERPVATASWRAPYAPTPARTRVMDQLARALAARRYSSRGSRCCFAVGRSFGSPGP